MVLTACLLLGISNVSVLVRWFLCFIDLIIRWNRVGLITERELMSCFLTIDSVLGDVSNLDVSRVGSPLFVDPEVSLKSERGSMSFCLTVDFRLGDQAARV